MAAVTSPRTEADRLSTLRDYELLDTPPESAFDRITALAATHFQVPVAIVSLVDQDRIWFKSHHGMEADQIPRAPGLCATAILGTESYIITDAAIDGRSSGNPLVNGPAGVRFYAAHPLVTHDGYSLGTMCILDFVPRSIDAAGVAVLQTLAALVMEQIALRLSSRRLHQTLSKLLQATPASPSMVTMCAWTKKVRLDGEWVTFEEYLVRELGVAVSHGMAPGAEQLYLGTSRDPK